LAILLPSAVISAGDADDPIEEVLLGALDDAERAERLVKAAGKEKTPPKTGVVMYEKAVHYGLTLARGHRHSLTALNKLQSMVPERKAEWARLRRELYRRNYRANRGAKRAVVGKHLIELLLDAAREKVAEGKVSQSLPFYREAVTVAKATGSPRRASIQADLDAIIHKAATEKKLTALLAAVEKSPDDVAAREKLITLYVVSLDDPAKAVAHINEDVGDVLRTYVPLAARPVGKVAPAVCLELGQWYRQHVAGASAAVRRIVLKRAVAYYKRYLSETKAGGLKRLKAKMKLEEMVKHLAELGGADAAAGAGFRTLDMRLAVNMGWKDRVAADGKGGWIDQGRNDMRNVRPGRKAFCGVPFDLIDAAANGGKSVLVLKSENFPAGPKSRSVAASGKARSIYFLHAAAWCNRNDHIATYVVRYADGTRAKISIRGHREIQDWQRPRDGDKCRLAFRVAGGKSGTAAMFVLAWENPSPEKPIKAVEFRSENSEGIAIIAAVTLSSKAASLPDTKAP